MSQELADFIGREFEEHLRLFTRKIVRYKNRRITPSSDS